MNPHTPLTQVVDMDKTMVNIVFPQDIGSINSLYGSSASGQSTSFHTRAFGFKRRVPRLYLLVGLILLLSAQTVWALPVINKKGQRVKIARHLVEGKKAIVQFHAAWSKTSGRYRVQLAKWQKKHPEYTVLVVDAKSLKSPVAKQFELKKVPSFLVYDEEGQLEMQGQKAHNEVIELLSDN